MENVALETNGAKTMLVAKTPTGIAMLKALHNIVNTTDPLDVISIGNLVKTKKGAVKKALQYKNFL